MTRAAAAAFAAVGAALAGGFAPRPAGVDLARLLADDPASKLGAYRLFADAAALTPNGDRVIPYDLNTTLFSDYARKDRWLFLPRGQKIRYRSTGALDFPVGATLIKTFAFSADLRRPDARVRAIETRLLIHRAAGWVAITYLWNDARSEAVLKRSGTRVPVNFVDTEGQARAIDYQIPNTNQCKECHALDGAVTPIGPKARNLNRDLHYADGTENQLAHWSRIGFLADAPPPATAPRMARWDDPAEPIAARARAYLDVNCGHCHNPEGFAGNSGLTLTYEESDPSRLGVGKRPVAAGRGTGGLEVSIDPGHPERSILAYRMAATEPGVAMPQIGRSVVHAEGLALVRAYIAQMSPGSGAR